MPYEMLRIIKDPDLKKLMKKIKKDNPENKAAYMWTEALKNGLRSWK